MSEVRNKARPPHHSAVNTLVTALARLPIGPGNTGVAASQVGHDLKIDGTPFTLEWTEGGKWRLVENFDAIGVDTETQAIRVTHGEFGEKDAPLILTALSRHLPRRRVAQCFDGQTLEAVDAAA